MSIKVGWSWPGTNEDPCCCEPACCMYPAAGLGVDYTVDDLPGTVVVNKPTGSSGVLSKSVGGGIYGTKYYGSSTFQIVLWDIYGDGPLWMILDLNDEDGFVSFVGNCLITGDGNFTPGDDGVEDQFEDSYDVAYGNGQTSTVHREGICYWRGEDSKGCGDVLLSYGGYYSIGTPDKTDKWVLEATYWDNTYGCESPVNLTKQGNQNTPVGTYIGFNGPATVS